MAFLAWHWANWTNISTDAFDSIRFVLNYSTEIILSWPVFHFYSSRSVYFHPLSSDKEFSVPSYVLQNEARAKGPRAYYEYSYLGSRGSHGPSGVEVFDDHTNVLFYAKITKNAIGCWLSNTTYTQNNHGSVNVLGFPSDVKIQSGTDKMWILTNQLHEFISNKTLDSVRFNFRVQFGKTSTIVKGNWKTKIVWFRRSNKLKCSLWVIIGKVHHANRNPFHRQRNGSHRENTHQKKKFRFLIRNELTLFLGTKSKHTENKQTQFQETIEFQLMLYIWKWAKK